MAGQSCSRDHKCNKCIAKTKQGEQCRRPTCKWGPYCYQHTPLEIMDAGHKGEGLFATRDIKKNTVIADYKQGKPLTQEQFEQKYPGGRATHVAKIGRTYYDASNVACSVAGKVNSGRGRNNARINNNGKLVTTKNISKGKEIEAGYSNAFRL